MSTNVEQDLLVVDAQAFQRDADPSDFSLEAIIAHERGHQLLARRPILSRMTASGISPVSEEILASLLGSIIAAKNKDRRDLFAKAVVEAVTHGMNAEHAVAVLHELRGNLEKTL